MVSNDDVAQLLGELAQQRPLFHSEADMQHALAWLIGENFPQWAIRLERPIPWDGRRAYADIWLRKRNESVVIELKYWTRALVVEIGGERYQLRNQAAQDISRYDFAKDLERVERVVERGLAGSGHVICLTNDQSYWHPGRRETADAAFRIHEGRELNGALAWSAKAGAGTVRGRAEAIQLAGSYAINWHSYSVVGEMRGGEFRYVLLSV